MSGQRRLTAAQKEKWARHRGPARPTTSVVSSNSRSDYEPRSARSRESQSYVGDSASSSEAEVDELESSDSYSDSGLTQDASECGPSFHILSR